MEVVPDFEDILAVLYTHEVRYLIIGGLAFIYHAKPRYTKDIDIWIDDDAENVRRANEALVEFGSPFTIDANSPSEIVQLGVAPNRIDLIRDVEGVPFGQAWEKRIAGSYGKAPAYWVDLESLIAIKSLIDNPRHQEDVRVLRQVQERLKKSQ